MTISPNLINEYRNSIVAYAKTLLEDNDNPFKVLAEGMNLDTLKAKYVIVFADDLKLQGVDTWASKRIAKEQVLDIMDSVLAEIN